MAEAHASEHHIIQPITFIKTFGALTVLMLATIFAAQINYGSNSPWVSYVANGIALTIACVKATLVIMNFMGVRFASRLTQVFAVLGFLWVTLMGITVCDYFTRAFEPNPGWEKIEPSPNTQMTSPKMVNPWGKAEEGSAKE